MGPKPEHHKVKMVGILTFEKGEALAAKWLTTTQASVERCSFRETSVVRYYAA